MSETPPAAAPYRTLIVDLDGTVADTFPAMQAAYSGAAGRAIPDQELLRLFGPGAGTEDDILAQLGVPADRLEHWYSVYTAAHRDLLPYPGIREGLAEAKRLGIRRGMLTGKGRRSTLITLEALGLDSLIEVVVTGDEAPAPKPDPGGLLMAATALHADLDRTVYVGDSIADLGAARAAGLCIAAALWDNRASIVRAEEEPDYRLRDAGDFMWLVKHLAISNLNHVRPQKPFPESRGREERV